MDEPIELRHVLLGIAVLAIPAGLVYFLISVGLSICPGSYPNAKFYTLNASEQHVKLAIQQVKEENPELCFREGGLEDHQSDYWFIVYFRLPDDGTVLMTWTRPEIQDSSDIKSTMRTTFAFCSFDPPNNRSGHWIDVCDCGKDEKKNMVAKFEDRILQKIIRRLQDPQS